MRSFNFGMTANSLQFDSWLLSSVNEPSNKNLNIKLIFSALLRGHFVWGGGLY